MTARFPVLATKARGHRPRLQFTDTTENTLRLNPDYRAAQYNSAIGGVRVADVLGRPALAGAMQISSPTPRASIVLNPLTSFAKLFSSLQFRLG